jgi:hypothetical protein
MDQFEQIQISNKKIVIKTVLLIILLACVIFLPSVGFFINQNNITKALQFENAKKVGNWTFPDENYSVADSSEFSMFGVSFAMVNIEDKNSNNNFILSRSPFEESEFLTSSGNLSNDILREYELENIKIIDKGELTVKNGIVEYIIARWNFYEYSNNKAEGFIGKLDCKKEAESILIFAINDIGKYDNSRALEFIKTFGCVIPDKEIVIEDEKNKLLDTKIEDKSQKIDSDNDGLSDNVENILNTSFNNPDSDGDGYTDFEEIKNGYDPLKKSPDDKYSEENYQFIKEEIKNIDEENYFEIFEEK